MRLLLDTHVMLWLVGEPEQVPAPVRATLADRENELLVSAISVLEIATKTRLGKLPHGELVLDSWAARAAEWLVVELPVSAAHARMAGSLVWDHRDPFDRVLVAQSAIEGVSLVTNDRAIAAYPGVAVLTW